MALGVLVVPVAKLSKTQPPERVIASVWLPVVVTVQADKPPSIAMTAKHRARLRSKKERFMDVEKKDKKNASCGNSLKIVFGCVLIRFATVPNNVYFLSKIPLSILLCNPLEVLFTYYQKFYA